MNRHCATYTLPGVRAYAQREESYHARALGPPPFVTLRKTSLKLNHVCALTHHTVRAHPQEQCAAGGQPGPVSHRRCQAESAGWLQTGLQAHRQCRMLHVPRSVRVFVFMCRCACVCACMRACVRAHVSACARTCVCVCWVLDVRAESDVRPCQP